MVRGHLSLAKLNLIGNMLRKIHRTVEDANDLQPPTAHAKKYHVFALDRHLAFGEQIVEEAPAIGFSRNFFKPIPQRIEVCILLFRALSLESVLADGPQTATAASVSSSVMTLRGPVA